MDGTSAAERRGKSTLDRRLQFQRGADETGSGNRSHHLTAAALRVVRREIEQEILPFCMNENIGVIVYSPMYAGLLTGAMTTERVAAFLPEDWRRNLPGFKEPVLSRNLRIVENLRGIGERHGRSPGEVAIAWTLSHPAVTGAIVGFRNAKQVAGIIGATDFRLNASELAEIENALKQENAI
jgi:aryl-alcohol dehydrogenase-like predicted oxidoreductase